MVGELVEEQPPTSVTVRVYVVVTEGDAAGEQLAALDSPVDGDHEQLTPPEPLSGVEDPAPIVAVPEATAVGIGFTVTVALPETVPEQFASATAVTE